MQKIPGREISREIIESLKGLNKPDKPLAVIFVGDELATIGFVSQKERACEELGLDFKKIQLDSGVSESDLIDKIREISRDVGGIIIQLPLPTEINQERVLSTIPKELDVDLLSDASKLEPLALAPSVGVVEEIVSRYELDLGNSVVAVVGIGKLVGGPISAWLDNRCKRLLLLDKGDDLSKTKEADIVISGVGIPGIIKSDNLNEGAIVIDFGVGKIDGGVGGDLEEKDLEKLSLYTPTPGGTGPILVAKLMENFYTLSNSREMKK